MRELQPATRGYITLLLGLAAGLTAMALTRTPQLQANAVVGTIIAAICTAAAWHFPIEFAPRTKFYVDTAVTVAAVLLLPPGLAALAVGLGALAAHGIRRDSRDWPQALFNASQTMLITLVAGLVLALAGWSPERPFVMRPQLVLVLPLVATMMYLLNILFVSAAGAFEQHRPVAVSFLAALHDDFKVEAVAFASLATTGLLAAMVASAYRWGLVLLAVPVVATYITVQHQARSRQQAERARIMSDAGLAEAQRLARIGSWQWRPATDHWIWSDEVYRLVGRTPECGSAGRDALLERLSTADRARLEATLQQAMYDGQAFEIEHRLTLPDGSVRVMHQRAEPHGAGQACAFLGTIQDVTERVQAEETMRLAKEAAQEADRAKTQLLSMASHDLRTPMTAIQGYLEIVIDGSAGDLLPEQREFLGIAHRNTLQLASLVNDLLDLARIEAGRLNLRRRPVDVGRAAAQTVHSLAPQASARGIDLRLERDGPAFADADPTRLDQMLQNLTGNAIKFTEQGSVTLRISNDTQWIEIAVVDTGIGITPEHVPYIFEEFNQGGEAGRRRGGAGLGLAIVRQLARLHEGEVTVQSEPGRGSTFTLRLPKATTSAATPRP